MHNAGRHNPGGAVQHPHVVRALLAGLLNNGILYPASLPPGFLMPAPSHAAPRTPLASPCTGGTSLVLTWSENTYSGSSAGIRSYSRAIFDIPPPRTTISGSSTLMIVASARAIRRS